MQAFDHQGSGVLPPAPPSHSRVEAGLEAICRKGCRLVQRDIERLERGEAIPECTGLTAAERDLLLRELRDIMAVYGDSCGVD